MGKHSADKTKYEAEQDRIDDENNEAVKEQEEDKKKTPPKQKIKAGEVDNGDNDD